MKFVNLKTFNLHIDNNLFLVMSFFFPYKLSGRK